MNKKHKKIQARPNNFLQNRNAIKQRAYHVLRATFSAPTEPATVAVVGEEGKDKELLREYDEWPPFRRKTNNNKTKTF